MTYPPGLLDTFLTRKTDEWFSRARAFLLDQIPCRAGCHACCIGPFPITLLDRQRLQDGMNCLPSARRERLEQRATEQIAALENAYPELGLSPYVNHWEDSHIDRIISDFSQEPCPALGAEGLCEIYEYRPLVCRSMGIPIEENGITYGACGVQTFVPIKRLSHAQRDEEDALASREAEALELLKSSAGCAGEEVLLPYGFASGRLSATQSVNLGLPGPGPLDRG